MIATAPIRVWDIPTRLFHWLLVMLIGFSWWSAENGSMDWHRQFGIILLALLLFRLIWGLIGANTARFGSFVRSPARVLAYLRSSAPAARSPGHNPIGGYSVVVILLLIALQIGTGLFAVDTDGLESGHLSFLVSFGQGRIAAGIHHLSFTLLQILAGLHIVAVLFYLIVRKRNLIRPMITGSDRQLETALGALAPASFLRSILAAAVAAGIAWLTSRGFFL